VSTNTNHIRYRLFINCLLFAFVVSLTTTGAVAYNVYYGQLHSHTNISDGSGSPAQAYQYARDTAKLDFFSIADHDYWPDDMTQNDWNTIKNAANSYNQDGTFVTFWGFEWTSDSTVWQPNGLAQGHITIINSNDFCISSYEPTRTLNQLVMWLDARDVVAFFNHPGQYDTHFDYFNFNYTDKIVGMELWNRWEDYYSNDGYYSDDGGLPYYDEALVRGWYIGASGSQDNHSANWGTMNEWRLAILAPEKTRASLFDAMKARRFYSCRDKNLVLSFTCAGAQMGSKIDGGVLDVVIEASDGDNEIFSRIDLLKNGAVIKTWTPNTTNPYVSTTVSGGLGDYFYVRVYQSGSGTAWQAISSPIFIISAYVHRVIDFNCDGRIDFKDFSILALYWLKDESSVDIAPMPLGDDMVDFKDIVVFAENWLTVAPPGQASNPNPANDAFSVDLNADLSWAAGVDATSHNVYFGTTEPPPFVHNQTAETFDPGPMAEYTTYFWRIDQLNAWGTTTGTLWHFTTESGPPP